jgi:phenylacetate-CoA ligase
MSISDFLDQNRNFRFDLKECLASFVYRDTLAERLHEFRCNIEGKSQGQVNPSYLLDLVCQHFSKTIPAYSFYSEYKEISELPLIDKSLVRVNPEKFCDTFSHTTLWKKVSSGTTGTPFSTYSDACFYFEELFLPLRKIALSRKIDVGHRDIFSVTLMAQWNWPPTVFQDPLEEVGLMARIPFDERNFSSISKILELLAQMKPELIVAKPPLFEAVLGCTKNWDLLKSLESKLIVSSGCLMSDELRSLLIEAFNCPVVDAYALSEFGLVGTECQMKNGLHVDMTSVMLEMFWEHLKVAKTVKKRVVH